MLLSGNLLHLYNYTLFLHPEIHQDPQQQELHNNFLEYYKLSVEEKHQNFESHL